MKKLSANEIRKIWIEFFQSKQHLFIPSKSLVPINDDSLLWINSGVATLKPYFSGTQTPPSKRLVNCQIALRTNDIENVGYSSRHHTFFEMLGNFSIGDYFKKEAISFAYELLIDKFEIDENLLFFTVYQNDKETFDIWKSLGIKEDHILKCSKERNFWDIGQGPCGPCTEIFYDRGEKYDFENRGISLLENDVENDRYIEIWNIVFSSYNNDGNNNYHELKNKNIDTGAGLERLASISQDTHTDFESDLFLDVINEIQKMTTKYKYDKNAIFNKDELQKKINRNFIIIADHMKACVFCIADGVSPSNKERGSIIRRLFRRSMVSIKQLEIYGNWIEKVVDAIINIMKDPYGYLLSHRDKIITILANELNTFNKTLNLGYELFESATKSGQIDPEIVFKLVDTYGFPFELIKDLTREKNIFVDEKIYENKFKSHQSISRNKQKMFTPLKQDLSSLVDFNVSSSFDYEKKDDMESTLVAIFDEQFIEKDSFVGKCWLVFDKTNFYATSGGQVHDDGFICLDNIQYKVHDVIKAPNGQHMHLVDINKQINIGMKFKLCIDWNKRQLVTNNHTTEHLLQHALQKVVDKTIQQKGAYKSFDKLTFDFEYKNVLTENQIIEIEKEVNRYIDNGYEVKTYLLSLQEAKEKGALAYFENVYSKIKSKLRVVEIGDVSIEICGGTHVNNTNQIEKFMIINLINKGENKWRIEALTTNNTINQYLQNQIEFIKKQIQYLNCQDITIISKIKNINYSISVENFRLLKQEFKSLQNEIKLIKFKNEKDRQIEELDKIYKTKQIKFEKLNLILIKLLDINTNSIKEALTKLVEKNDHEIYLILNQTKDKVQYFACLSKKANIKITYSAISLIQLINMITHGNGGGNINFAQGACSVDNIDKFYKHLNI